MRKSVACVLALALLVFASVAQAEPTRETRVYTDLNQFRMATAKVTPRKLTEAAKKVRRQAMVRAVQGVSLEDRASLEKIAAKQGFTMYNPNLLRGAIGQGFVPLSSPSDVTRIYAPAMFVDDWTGEKAFMGAVQWRDPATVKKDAPTAAGPVGGMDGAGLVFTNVSDRSKIVDWQMTTFDFRGRAKYTYTNPTLGTGSGNKLAVVFMGQDKFLGFLSSNGVYDWARMHAWVFFDASWSDRGQVSMTYAHDYKTTRLTGISFNNGSSTGPGGVTLNSGLTYQFSSAEHRWAADGYYASY